MRKNEKKERKKTNDESYQRKKFQKNVDLAYATNPRCKLLRKRREEDKDVVQRKIRDERG